MPFEPRSFSLPRVSIIINNHNYARFLRRSIDSALAQTHPIVDVVVVDDLSTDDSRAIIASYADRLQPVLQPVNRGQGAAFNAGFAASRGDIVMFLDADDYLYPQAAAQVAAAWKPGLSKVHFRLDLVDAQERHIDMHPAAEMQLDEGDVVPLLLRSGRYIGPVTSGNAFGRAALQAVMPVPEASFRMCADGYLVTVAPFHGPVAAIDSPLGAYRQHGGNLFAGLGQSLAGQGVVEQMALRMRNSLRHDTEKAAVLQVAAAASGQSVHGSPGLRDAVHLETRLASVRLDAAAHPYPADNRWALGLRGAWASRHVRLSWTRRLVMAAWFLLVAGLPTAAARPLVCWRLVPASRPAGIDRWLKRVRRVLH